MKLIKFIISIVLVLSLIACFTSCQSQNKPSDSTNTQNEPATSSDTNQTTLPTISTEETPQESVNTEPTSTSPEVVIPETTTISEIKKFTSPSTKIEVITYQILYTDGTSEEFKISISPIRYSISEHKSNAGFFKVSDGTVGVYIEPYVSDKLGASHMYEAMPYYTWVEIEGDDGSVVRYEDGYIHKYVFSGPLGLITDMEEIMDTPGEYDGLVYILVYSAGGDYIGTVNIPITITAS